MTEPADFDETKDRYIVLAAKKWPIPDLVPRQLRHVRGPLREFNERLRSSVDKERVGEFIQLSEADYENLLLKPIFYGLTRAHPGLKFEEFLDWPMGEVELMLAWFRVREASGLFDTAPSGAQTDGDKPAGEAEAPAPTK